MTTKRNRTNYMPHDALTGPLTERDSERLRQRRARELANDVVEIKRLRRLLENPRRNYWRKFDDATANKKYERIRKRAGLVDERMFNVQAEA